VADNKAIVLIVDDEARTRELERRILEMGPYQVIEASGATEAFAVLDSGQQVDLAICDLEMPEMPGEEVMQGMRARRPTLKVLYVSGVVDRLLDARKILGDGEAFLDKPFTSKGLLEAVSLLLYDTLSPPARF
jgi:two-component system cell cycle sensor histidine kinase/response regulator CckA